MSKLFYYDLETTGTLFWKNGIHQISGIIEIDGEIVEKFNFNVCPYEKALIDREALKVSNVTEEQIKAYPKMDVVYQQIIEMLSKYVDRYNKKDKFHLVGFNIASFDNQFFRAFFVQNGDDYFGSWFWSDCLDCFILASNKLKDKRSEMINFKQSTVAQHLGIEVDETKLHDAIYDVEVCRSIFKIVS